MRYTRHEVVGILRRAGFLEEADAALRELPESIDVDELGKWAYEHGITRDVLISEMGGSP